MKVSRSKSFSGVLNREDLYDDRMAHLSHILVSVSVDSGKCVVVANIYRLSRYRIVTLEVLPGCLECIGFVQYLT